MAQAITLTTEGLLLNWLKEVGDAVKKGEVIAEVEADKATMEVEAPADGVLISQTAEVGEELEEGAVIGEIGDADEAGGAKSADEKPKQEAKAEAEDADESDDGEADDESSSTTEDGRVKASPLARNIAEERGIDLSRVKGTGPNGRIVKADVENFDPDAAPAQPKQSKAKAADDSAAPPVSSRTWGKLPQEDVEIEDISRMRRAIADGTINSFMNIPHFYINREIAIDELLATRKRINAELEAEGIKISVNDMVVKAIALTLRRYPNMNTHYYGDKLVRHKRINIGISVALPNNGLVNVVAHDADKRSLSDLAEANKAMFERARQGKIKPDDTRNATFTVSNLGPYNVEWFSAIISPPEAGIIAVGAGKKKPVVLEDGTLGVATIMSATLSIDHRISDGAEGAQFMEDLKTLLENPMRLLV